MMTLTQAKQVIRDIRADLVARSQEDLDVITGMHILFKDDTPPETRAWYGLRQRLVQRMLDAKSSQDKRPQHARRNQTLYPGVFSFPHR